MCQVKGLRASSMASCRCGKGGRVLGRSLFVTFFSLFFFFSVSFSLRSRALISSLFFLLLFHASSSFYFFSTILFPSPLNRSLFTSFLFHRSLPRHFPSHIPSVLHSFPPTSYLLVLVFPSIIPCIFLFFLPTLVALPYPPPPCLFPSPKLENRSLDRLSLPGLGCHTDVTPEASRVSAT